MTHETLFQELKRYVGFEPSDEQALRDVGPLVASDFGRVADVFYRRIFEHEDARRALEGGESQVGRLKTTLVAWMEKLFAGPWDECYFDMRARIGRVHVRISLPQHYMFGAMNVIRTELDGTIGAKLAERSAERARALAALSKILDLELAIMLHTYREDLAAQQSRTERLATFGQLVGSIGHELRNPLGVIESSLFILRGRVGTDERAQKHVRRIGEQLGIANNIISALLDMIRDRPLHSEQVRLSAVLESVIGSLAAPEGVAVVVEDMDLPPIEGDPVQLRQVLANLVENAIHACGAKGTVHVLGRVLGEEVEVIVEDTGAGVDRDTRRRLFEPLVTTKAKGIGLGLALVKRIVERHGGTVRYETGTTGGARFVVRLLTNKGGGGIA